MSTAPWWLLAAALHLGLGAALWRFRRTDHPWLLWLLGAQWVTLLVRGLLAPVGLGGLALLGDPTRDAVAARAALFGADVFGWAVLAMAAHRLAGGNVRGRSGWAALGAVLAGAALGASGGDHHAALVWQRVLLYGVVAPLPVVYAAVRVVSHLRDCVRRRISVDILALAVQLVGLRLLLAWVDVLQPGPLVHPALELVFHTVSLVALFGLYGLSKRAAWSRRARE